MKIRNQISNDITELNRLHSIFAWIPNEHMIRPTIEELVKKRTIMEEVHKEWLDLCDYILHTVFNSPIVLMLNIKTAGNCNSLPTYVFKESAFRYNLLPTVHHYVLWFSQCNYESGLEKHNAGMITSIVTKELEILTKNDLSFEFAWYTNPKPSVSDFFHVQVFWITGTN